MHGTICDTRTVSAAELPAEPVWRIRDVLDGITAASAKAQSRALATVVIGSVTVGTLLSASGSVLAQTSLERQAQCELSAIRDTRSAVAVQLIRSACNWLALNGDSLLNESSKPYYVCLVRELSGVQANEAAGAIVSACRTSYPP